MAVRLLYLFDIDGTILLAGGAGSIALNRVFAEQHGVAGAFDGIRPGGKTDSGIVGEMFANALGRAPSREEIDALLTDYVPVLREEIPRAERYRMMPAVVETLDFLAEQEGVLLGIATGNIQGSARVKLEHFDLWHRFAVGGYGDDCDDRPGLVERAIERACEHAGEEIPRDAIVVVGDTPRDVSAARACRVRAIAVATGPSDRAALEQSQPDALFDSLAELPAWHRSQDQDQYQDQDQD